MTTEPTLTAQTLIVDDRYVVGSAPMWKMHPLVRCAAKQYKNSLCRLFESFNVGVLRIGIWFFLAWSDPVFFNTKILKLEAILSFKS
jgi:hypothetical protein